MARLAAALTCLLRPDFFVPPRPKRRITLLLAGGFLPVALSGIAPAGIVTLATFTCQPREAVIGRRQENQWLGELQRGTGPLQNPLFLANVTMPFSGHSLRAGLASSAEVDERYVQKQLGHASAEITRRYQRRRDRFRVNLTKAAGL